MIRLGQIRQEWALLGIIAVVCGILSFLQYRWTGELSRGELQRLRSGLNEQVGRLARAFDDEIRQNYTALLPDAALLRQKDLIDVHRARYAQWAASHDRSLIARIGIAVPEQGTLHLYGIGNDGQVRPMDWPASWDALRSAMTARVNGAAAFPAAPSASTLLEIPIFDGRGGRGNPGPELEWMIFELNENYIRAKILPGLVAEYLNPGEAVYDASVTWSARPSDVIFSTRSDRSSVLRGADATIGILPTAMGGRGRGRRGRFGEDEPSARWTLAVRHRAGSLEAAVSIARTRNLVTSLLLIGLLGGAAWALVQSTARSRRLSEMQFRFAAGVSHDLRTPLTAIRGAAFNLVDGVVKEPHAVERYSKLILRNAEELTSMIENVLAFSASLPSKAKQQPEMFQVGDLLNHAAAALEDEAAQAGCRIELTVAPELPALAGDPVALELAFRNLIGNAIRHAAEGKWVGVSAARAAGGVEVRVCDRGPGIPDPELAAIFDPFYRGEQTRARRVPGTGLGLSLVKNTVERQGGTVAVQNSPGGGAQFTLRFPAVREAA